MNDTKALQMIVEAVVAYADNEGMNYLGKQMFRMYTEAGYPPDMFLDEMGKTDKGLSLLAKVYITSVYQTEFLEHRRKSGVQEKNIDKLRKRNREDIKRLIETGELGIY